MKTGYEQHFKKVKQTSKANPSAVKKSNFVKQKREKKSSFPTKSLFIFAMIAGIGLVAVENFDQIESQVKRIEIGVGLAQAEEKPASKVPAAAAEAVVAAEHSADSKAIAIEKPIDESDYLFKLSERKKQLDQREEDLNKLSAEIAKQKGEIEEKLLKLEETRQKISTALEEKIKADDGKVETLVQMYSNMKPQQAAKVFETLDEDLVIEILGRMKKKNAADILNLIKAEKAQVFAERYVGYRVPASK
jgi:flagellar motility protein MotE (MotC chaperone)